MEILVILLGLIGIGIMIWRREWMLYVLAVSLPFERIPTFELSGVTVRFGNIIVLGALVLWLFELGKKKFRFDKMDWFLVLYLLVGLISLSQAVDMQRGFMVWGFTLYVLLVYFLVKEKISQGKQDELAKVLICVGVLVGILGLLQFLGDVANISRLFTGLEHRYQKAILGFPRIQSVALEPLYLANFIFIPLGLLLAGKLGSKKYFRGGYDDLFLILLMAVMVLTVSRGAYLGVVAIIISGIVIFLRGLKKEVVWRLITDMAVAILIAFIFIYAAGMMTGGKKKGGSVAVNKFTSHAADKADFSSADRLTTAKKGLEAWRQSPIIGIGMGQFGEFISSRSKGVSKKQIVNNEPVELLAETGLLGFLAIFGFLVMLMVRLIGGLRNLRGDERLYAGALLLILIGFVVQYQFFSTLYIVWIWFMMGWMSGVSDV